MKILRTTLCLVLGGLLYFLAMPPIGWWWAAPLGIFLLASSSLKKFYYWVPVGILINFALGFWIAKVSVVAWIALAVFVGALWSVPLWLWGKNKNRVLVAAAWVSIEWFRTYLGFGWLPLGTSIVGCPFLLRIASVGGEGLLGFLIVFFALTLARAFDEKDARKKILLFREMFLFVPMVLILGLCVSEPLNLKDAQKIKIGLVQPDVSMNPQTDKDYLHELEILRRTTNLLRQDEPDAYFWPEQATPWPVNDDAKMRAWIEGGAKFLDRPIVSGVLYREKDIYYNAATVIDPISGVEMNAYKKQRLVPFGEYIPFANWGLMHSLTPIVDSFGAGTEPVVLKLQLPAQRSASMSAAITLWPLICYEDAFDFLSWGAARKADVIVVFLNDSWFGWGARQQHAAHSVLRSVEQGLPVIRASNNGASGVILPDGSADYLNMPNIIPTPTCGVFELPLVRVETFYSWTAAWWRSGFVALAVVGIFISRKNENP